MGHITPKSSSAEKLGSKRLQFAWLNRQFRIEETSANQLLAFFEELQRWNSVYRLVGSDNIEVLYDKHLTDAVILRDYLQGTGRLVDLGAGAGLPAIPLCILRPDLQIVLVESQGKRINFCVSVQRRLRLHGIRIIRGRAEHSSVVEAVGACRWVLSRATWKLHQYLAIAKLYVNNPTILALKGEDWRGELAGLAEPVEVLPYETPISGLRRVLLVFSYPEVNKVFF